jgi:hypothetical protein
MRITGSLALVFVLAFTAGVLHGCGGSGAKATPKCTLNSTCAGNLVCALGFCVNACNDNGSKDCNGGLCVKSDQGNVCRAPEVAKKCALNSECASPLVCGKDLTCRTECMADVDCPLGDKPMGTPGRQVCTVSGTCADPAVDKTYDPATNDFKAPTTGTAGSTGSGGALGGAGGGAGGSTGQAGAGGGAAGASGGSTGTAGSNPDGGGAGMGAAGSMTDGGGMNPEVAVMTDGTMVMPSSKLRQGQQSTLSLTVTVTRTMGGLGNAMVVGDNGGLKVTVDASSTAMSLVLKVAAPHATPLGKKTITVSTASGTVTLTDVVEVTAITAAPTGADSPNTGASDSPFRSLKNAIAVADVGDTIHLVDGTYSALPTASGGSAETWGYTLPSDLTVIGDSTAGTILDGVGVNSVDGFDVLKSLTLQNLTIQDFRYGVDVNKDTSTLKMTDVVITSTSSYGLYVEAAGANSTITIAGMKSLITQSTQVAFYANGVQNLTTNITDATIQAGGDAIQWGGNMSGSKLTMTGGTLKALMTYNAVDFYYVNNNAMGTTLTLNNVAVIGTITDSDAKGTVSITGGTITQKSGDNIDFGGSILNVTGTTLMMTALNNQISISSTIGSMITLSNVMINGGGRGVNQAGAGSQLKLRGTTIQNTSYDALYLTNGNLDLGTMTESGNNFLATPVMGNYYYCLNVSRSTGTATPVTSKDTSIGVAGAVPSPQTIDATAGTVTLLPKWNVYTGNKINFY